MYLIFGLGNPGREYHCTRHNVGFDVIDKLSYDNNIKVNRLKFKSITGEGSVCGKKVILVKPQTYMNLSGSAVRDFVNFYKSPPEKIIIIYDDTSLPLGSIRIRKKGTNGGHNGVGNIIYSLNTDIFPRIKVGIGKKPSDWDLADFVLSKFNKEEISVLAPAIERAAQTVETIVTDGIEKAMNLFNTIAKEAVSERDE